jgi:hypothetical protein
LAGATSFRPTLPITATLTTLSMRSVADTLPRFAADGPGPRLRHTEAALPVLSAGADAGNYRRCEHSDMSDLVKWRGGQLSLEEKIDRWRRLRKRETLIVPDAPPVLAATETRLDLPRTCAVTRKPWAARYLREDAGFGYIRSVIPDGRIRLTLYRPDDLRTLPDFKAGIEDCPHCGAYTPDGYLGSVLCEVCRSWVCFGLTSREGMFTCGCGHRGPLVASTQTAMGVVLR